jgi:hypothetical protein
LVEVDSLGLEGGGDLVWGGIAQGMILPASMKMGKFKMSAERAFMDSGVGDVGGAGDNKQTSWVDEDDRGGI